VSVVWLDGVVIKHAQ